MWEMRLKKKTQENANALTGSPCGSALGVRVCVCVCLFVSVCVCDITDSRCARGHGGRVATWRTTPAAGAWFRV